MMSEHFNWEKILEVCQKVCYFFMMNLLFVLFNLPVLLFLLFVGITQVRTYLPLFLLCLIAMPLSLCGVFAGMERVHSDTERSAWKDFFAEYRRRVPQKLKLAAGQMLAVLILWTNVEFFTMQAAILPLALMFLALLLFTLLLTPRLYLLLIREEEEGKTDNIMLLQRACLLTIKKPVVTLGNIAALFVVLMAVELMAGTAVLFMGSLYGCIVVYMNREL